MEKGFDIDLNKEMKFSDEGIFSKVLHKGEGFSYTLMCLGAGSDIDTHTSTKNASVQVVKGAGEFVLFDRKIALSPGVFIYMPANAPHSLRADEDLAILLTLVE